VALVTRQMLKVREHLRDRKFSEAREGLEGLRQVQDLAREEFSFRWMSR